jgi:hypothetical protein
MGLLKIKQFICGLKGHHFSKWVSCINAKRERRWCCSCGLNEERRTI